MYHTPYFKERDRETLLRFMDENPFVFMAGSFLSGIPVATQIPVLLEERESTLYLQGHIMRNTDHHNAFVENPNVLMVFTGPDCYVSATWYKGPQEASTWNYMSVHVTGRINFMTDEQLINFMRKLTLKFEQGNTLSSTVYDNLPDGYLNKMLPAIVGFEIKADNIQNVFKLSQNRDEKSYLNIISNLDQQGGQSGMIAAEMRKRQSRLFPEREK